MKLLQGVNAAILAAMVARSAQGRAGIRTEHELDKRVELFNLLIG